MRIARLRRPLILATLAGGVFIFGALSFGCAAPETASLVSNERERPAPNPNRDAFFGDLHVHTRYSFDAFIFNVRASPDQAYEYAKGAPIEHAGGFDIQLESGALDFMAVTDHATYLGVLPAMSDPQSELHGLDVAAEMRGDTGMTIRERFYGMIDFMNSDDPGFDPDPTRASAWASIVESANRHNDPGHFTAFVGYEYTASPDRNNMHRNVIFRGSEAPALPFSRVDSANAEDLWDWMDAQRAQGMEALAIPHNSNGSGGQMFKLSTFDGTPFDAAYADQRMRNEPLVEISQVKGTSEVHPLLSPNDEWADFEIMPFKIATTILSEPTGSYVRDALRNGLAFQEEQGFNPFAFGIMASTDTHNGAPTPEESNYHSKVGLRDATGQLRGSVPLDEPNEDGSLYLDTYYNTWGASGLAGVWAEENTRDSLYGALRRKETFGTSGPRMRIRFFAGFDYDDGILESADMITGAYAGGVPMGGDLINTDGATPKFLAWATRDARSAPLQRLQMIKLWIDDDGSHEAVIDVACSDGLMPESGRCPDNGATVDLSDCSISAGLGAKELKAVWSDPDFDAQERAAYYVRVLENPVCRWSTWDALRAGVAPSPALHSTIQERAWSSPIWVMPAGD